MLNQVFRVTSGTCQQFVEERTQSKSVTLLDFRLTKGSVATYCRWTCWGGNVLV